MEIMSPEPDPIIRVFRSTKWLFYEGYQRKIPTTVLLNACLHSLEINCASLPILVSFLMALRSPARDAPKINLLYTS